MHFISDTKVKRRLFGAAIFRSSGISLIETIVVVAITSVLVMAVTAFASNALQRAKSSQCLAKMRSLGAGVLLYSQDNNGEFPRSLHSAASAGKQPWGRSILPYLGYATDPTTSEWAAIFNKAYRCPADKSLDVNIWSYALNVYFELTPDGDDYAGMPATWRRYVNVSKGSRTILLAEPKAVYYADHFMCHYWTSARGAENAVDALRHGKMSNFLFVDGHVEALALADTFDPSKRVDLWNPSRAGTY